MWAMISRGMPGRSIPEPQQRSTVRTPAHSRSVCLPPFLTYPLPFPRPAHSCESSRTLPCCSLEELRPFILKTEHAHLLKGWGGAGAEGTPKKPRT